MKDVEFPVIFSVIEKQCNQPLAYVFRNCNRENE